ncbi:hypothetical protein JXQ31_16085, partial [candidate division KSB1 bacterium]|nr:hypothetical protein [candidate division KSB1 bacterium]
TFCSPVPPILQFGVSPPGMNTLRVYSLVEPLESGTVCSFTGIYDRQFAGPEGLPAIRVFDPENGTGFAYLSDTLTVPLGTLIKIKGLVIKELLRIKPATEIRVKKIKVGEITVLTEKGVYITKANHLYTKNLKRMQKYNDRNKIDLKLPSKIDWRMLYDNSNFNMIACAVTGNGIYESRMECVFEKNSGVVRSLYFNSHIKGE